MENKKEKRKKKILIMNAYYLPGHKGRWSNSIM